MRIVAMRRRCTSPYSPSFRHFDCPMPVGVVPVEQKLPAKVQNVLAENQSHDIGGIISMLLVDRIDGGGEPIISSDIDDRKVIGLRKLPSELSWKPLVECCWYEEIQLVGIADSGFVGQMG